MTRTELAATLAHKYPQMYVVTPAPPRVPSYWALEADALLEQQKYAGKGESTTLTVIPWAQAPMAARAHRLVFMGWRYVVQQQCRGSWPCAAGLIQTAEYKACVAAIDEAAKTITAKEAQELGVMAKEADELGVMQAFCDLRDLLRGVAV